MTAAVLSLKSVSQTALATPLKTMEIIPCPDWVTCEGGWTSPNVQNNCMHSLRGLQLWVFQAACGQSSNLSSSP